MKKAFLTLGVCLAAMLMSADFSWAQCDTGCDTGYSSGGRLGRLRGGFGGGGLSGLKAKLGSVNYLNPGYTGAQGIMNDEGMVQPVPGANTNPLAAVKRGLSDPFTPNRIYAYSETGVEAGYTHDWNQQQMQSYPWHGGYNYWKYERPTALVVPPTAGFQTEYAWGVAQTRSMPIYHQFRPGGGMSGGGGGMGAQNSPYWPSSTDQMGVYPVRGPWGR